MDTIVEQTKKTKNTKRSKKTKDAGRSLRMRNQAGTTIKRRSAEEARRAPFLTLQMSTRLFKKLENPSRSTEHKNPYTDKNEFKFGDDKLFQWPRPTPYDIRTVTNALGSKESPSSSVVVDTDPANNPFHGGSRFTVDSIVRVIIAAACSNEVAMTVQQTMIVAYPYFVDGVQVEGTKPNYHAMRLQGRDKLRKVLKDSGLVKKRPFYIKKMLDIVYATNMKDLSPGEPGEDRYADNKRNAADFVPGTLSVDYIGRIYKDGGKQKLMDYLVSLPGVAVKSACCLMSFNMGLPVFAVDTHVLGMARLLG